MLLCANPDSEKAALRKSGVHREDGGLSHTRGGERAGGEFKEPWRVPPRRTFRSLGRSALEEKLSRIEEKLSRIEESRIEGPQELRWNSSRVLLEALIAKIHVGPQAGRRGLLGRRPRRSVSGVFCSPKPKALREQTREAGTCVESGRVARAPGWLFQKAGLSNRERFVGGLAEPGLWHGP